LPKKSDESQKLGFRLPKKSDFAKEIDLPKKSDESQKIGFRLAKEIR